MFNDVVRKAYMRNQNKIPTDKKIELFIKRNPLLNGAIKVEDTTKEIKTQIDIIIEEIFELDSMYEEFLTKKVDFGKDFFDLIEKFMEGEIKK